MDKKGGMPLCLCGKLHILVVFWFFEILSKKERDSGVHCDVNAHACLHGEPFIFNSTLTPLFWVFSGGLLEFPVHVIMCAAVQWSRQFRPSLAPHIRPEKGGNTNPNHNDYALLPSSRKRWSINSSRSFSIKHSRIGHSWFPFLMSASSI